MHIQQISAVVCAFISLLFLLIALGSDYWLANSFSSSGLWRICSYVSSSSGCYSVGMDGAGGVIHATRAFMFFGMIAGAVSCIGLCCTFFAFQLGSISMSKSSAVASLVAAVCVLIAMATFTGSVGSNVSYGWSFGLGWASFPLFLITGGLAFPLDNAISA